MKYVEAPNNVNNEVGVPSLFLGGGITNCKDWQSKLVDVLKNYEVTIYNPRRSNFDINKVEDSKIQIKWEHKYLHSANILVFYFAQETVCPITLFELGAALERNTYSEVVQDIIVYCEPEYSRKFDVKIQIELARKNARGYRKNYFVKYYDDYDDFVSEIKETVDLAPIYL